MNEDFGAMIKNNGKLHVEDNQLVISSGDIITLNDDQYEGVKKIRTWLKSDKTFFTLAGHAGTGKSTIIKKILDAYRYGVIVSAPTHKAKKVIIDITGRDGKTMHALLGLRPDVSLESFNPNQPIFSPIAVPKITDYNFVIIDEASLINKALFGLIREKVAGSRTKILFMGDPAQIPPVGETASIIFSQEDIEKHVLTKVERQKNGNPLLYVYDDMRNNQDKIDGGFLRKTLVNDKGEGIIFTVNKREFRKEVLIKFLSKEYRENSDYCKVIAWKNETVMKTNSIIRTALFGENADIVEINDVLMGYRIISNDKQTINIIENSADYRVVGKSKLVENSYGIKGFNVKLVEDLGKGKLKGENVFIINADDKENLHLYGQMHDFFRDLAKSNKKLWPKYYTFRRCNILMKTIEEYANGKPRNDEDIIVKDIDYGFALTGHKSQGSTYKHVMVIESDIKENPNIVERNQIMYVASSRPEISATVLTTRIDE